MIWMMIVIDYDRNSKFNKFDKTEYSRNLVFTIWECSENLQHKQKPEIRHHSSLDGWCYVNKTVSYNTKWVYGAVSSKPYHTESKSVSRT